MSISFGQSFAAFAMLHLAIVATAKGRELGAWRDRLTGHGFSARGRHPAMVTR